MKRKYQLISHDAGTKAERLFKDGCGDIESIEVLDELLDLIRGTKEDATFIQKDGREIDMDKIWRMRENLGFNFCH